MTDALRDTVAAAVEKHGVARVAAAADVTAQTLRRYLAGAPIRSDTREKLEQWATPASPVRLEWNGRTHGSGL